MEGLLDSSDGAGPGVLFSALFFQGHRNHNLVFQLFLPIRQVCSGQKQLWVLGLLLWIDPLIRVSPLNTQEEAPLKGCSLPTLCRIVPGPWKGKDRGAKVQGQQTSPQLLSATSHPSRALCYSVVTPRQLLPSSVVKRWASIVPGK